MRTWQACVTMAALLLGACSADEAIATRAGFRGTVDISVMLEGNGYDPNGFTYIIGHTRSGRIPPGSSLEVTEVGEGSHVVSLTDVAPHCELRSPVTIDVRDGATTPVTLVVHCLSGISWSQFDFAGFWQVMHLEEDGTVRPLTPLTEHSFPREWSPDGSQLLIERYDIPPAGPVHILTNPDLYRLNANGSDRRQLTTFSGSDFDPRWSPDGARILYSRWDSGFRLRVMNADGTTEYQLATPTGDDLDAVWAANASEIVFVCTRFEGHRSLCRVNPDGTEIGPFVSVTGAGEPRVSPDGMFVAFTSDASTGRTLQVVRVDGSGMVNVSPGKPVLAAEWSPTSTQLAFSTADNRIYRVNRDGSQQFELGRDTAAMASFQGVGGATPRWSPDGEWITFTKRGAYGAQSIWVMRADGTRARLIHDGWEAKVDVIWHPLARPGSATAARSVPSPLFAPSRR